MTGAPVPKGADAIVMVEHVRRDGGAVAIDRSAAPGDFINPAGSEARAAQAVLPAGFRLGYAQIALLATFGQAQVKVYRRPRVAILSTGDEVVPIEATPTHTAGAQLERSLRGGAGGALRRHAHHPARGARRDGGDAAS